MNLRTPGMLSLAAGLALVSAAAWAQEPPTAAPAAREAAATAATPLKLSNKWRIEVSEGANNTGALLFRVTPDKGTAMDIVVRIEKGRSENGVATDVKNTLKKALDPKVYHVEKDDGEDVLVKKRKGPNFELKFVESTLKGTRIDIDRE